MQTEPLVNQYLDECESRGLSPKTLEQRRWALQRLIFECPNLPSSDAELLPVLSDTELAIESRRDLEKCLRTFFRWATKRYQVENPTLDLDPLPYKMQLRRVLTQQEIMQLLRRCPHSARPGLDIGDHGLWASAGRSCRPPV